MNLLRKSRALLYGKLGQLDYPAGLSRFVDCTNDANVCQTFEAGGFGLLIVENAVGEVNQFGGELIALAKSFRRRFRSNGYALFEGQGIVVGRFGGQDALGADQAVTADIGGAEAAGESREPLPGKRMRTEVISSILRKRRSVLLALKADTEVGSVPKR